MVLTTVETTNEKLPTPEYYDAEGRVNRDFAADLANRAFCSYADFLFTSDANREQALGMSEKQRDAAALDLKELERQQGIAVQNEKAFLEAVDSKERGMCLFRLENALIGISRALRQAGVNKGDTKPTEYVCRLACTNHRLIFLRSKTGTFDQKGIDALQRLADEREALSGRANSLLSGNQ